MSPIGANSITVRAGYPNKVGMLGKITTSIGKAGGDISGIDIVSSDSDSITRDISINTLDIAHAQAVVNEIRSIASVRIINVSDLTFLRHLGGKIEVAAKRPVKTRNELSMVYTPGVARVSLAIHENPDSVWSLTTKGNSVAIVTDGSRVLGLGNIGPEAALPVMEGKSLLFKELSGVDAWPICLATQDPDEIVEAVKHIAPGFGAINLEDIESPRCFYVENRLRNELDIPVFHDDQHGTAVAVLAALINAAKVVNKQLVDLSVVICGVGAAGNASARLLLSAGIKNVIGYDREGILRRADSHKYDPVHRAFAEVTNPSNLGGTLDQALVGADALICLSSPGSVTVKQIKKMAKDPIVFALANPQPEIMPENLEGIAKVVATGRSDYANQVNNALCFPGIFRGALDTRARCINEQMELAAAYAIAESVPGSSLNEDLIVPSVFDHKAMQRVAKAVARAASQTGVARRMKWKIPEYATK